MVVCNTIITGPRPDIGIIVRSQLVRLTKRNTPKLLSSVASQSKGSKACPPEIF